MDELRKQQFAVILLLNDKASQRGIRWVLGDVLAGDLRQQVEATANQDRITEVRGDVPPSLGRNDRVLVFYAGHGVSVGKGKDESAMGKDERMGYLVPVDGDRDQIVSTGISMAELVRWFEGYQCKHVMFVADACYSGLALPTRAIPRSATSRDYLLEVTRRPVRMVFTAGGAGEEAHEWQGQGLFTGLFLAAVNGAADADHNGIVTSDEIASYVKPKVWQTSMSQFGKPQNPQVGRSGEGEFVFVVGPTGGAGPPEIPGRDGAPMVLVPGGEFTMGSNDGPLDERPVHPVAVGSFYVHRHEVTNEVFAKFLTEWRRDTDAEGHWMLYESRMGLRKSEGKWGPQPGYAECPVVGVTWHGANQYAKHYGMRLPTEAEWEYLCRAGSRGRWCSGDDENEAGRYAWYQANSRKRTQPVGRRRPNDFRLFDVHGNVREWCADWYDPTYYAAGTYQDPQGPPTGEYRVVRGGSWNDVIGNCRSAARGMIRPDSGGDYYGFRCVAPPEYPLAAPVR